MSTLNIFLIYLIFQLKFFIIKFMRTRLKNISINFMEIKIKNFLFSIGLNEKYISFDYLTSILIFLIKKDNSDFSTYHEAVCWLMNKYGVSSRTIIQGLHKIISMCNHPSITSLPQFKLGKSKTIHKIRIIKIFAENHLLEISI